MQCLLVQHLYSKKLITSLQDDCTTKLCCEHSPSSRHVWCGLADSSTSLGLGQLRAQGLAKPETRVVIVSIIQRTRSNSLPSGGLMPLSEGGLLLSPYCKQSSNRAALAHPRTCGFAVLLSSHKTVHHQNQVLWPLVCKVFAMQELAGDVQDTAVSLSSPPRSWSSSGD